MEACEEKLNFDGLYASSLKELFHYLNKMSMLFTITIRYLYCFINKKLQIKHNVFFTKFQSIKLSQSFTSGKVMHTVLQATAD